MMKRWAALPLLCLLAGATMSRGHDLGYDHDHDHDHDKDEAHAHEGFWIGEFELSAGTHTLALSKVGGKYAADTLAVSALRVAAGGLAGAESLVVRHLEHATGSHCGGHDEDEHGDEHDDEHDHADHADDHEDEDDHADHADEHDHDHDHDHEEHTEEHGDEHEGEEDHHEDEVEVDHADHEDEMPCPEILSAGSSWELPMAARRQAAAPVLRSLAMDQESSVTLFKLIVPAAGSYVIGSEHMFTEFDGGMPYLTGPDGTAVAPTAVVGEQCDAGFSTTQLWGYSMAGSMLGAAMSLIGAIILIPFMLGGGSIDLKYNFIISAFAAGILIGLVFLHLIPEAISLAGLTWQVSTMVIAGYFVGLMTEHILMMLGLGHSHSGHAHGGEDRTGDESEGENALRRGGPEHEHHPPAHAQGLLGHAHDIFPHTPPPFVAVPPHKLANGGFVLPASSSGTNIPSGPSVPSKPQSEASVDVGRVLDEEAGTAPKASLVRSFLSPIIINILVGDFFHNLFDGIAIGTAFRACGGLGWVVSASVILHELPQEISDFAILVRAGLPVPWALLANLCSSLSSLIGVAIALLVGEEGEGLDNSMGLILGFSAGILLYVGSGLIQEVVKCRTRSGFSAAWLVLIFGVVINGLLKMWHVHCDTCGAGMEGGAGVEGGGHDGHDH